MIVENPDNRIDWIVPATPVDDALVRQPTTAELAERERVRQKQLADTLLGGSVLTLEDNGRDPYNSIGRRPR